MIRDMILKNRSYRRFDESIVVTEQALRDMVDCARVSASGANNQPLKYKIVSGYDERVFRHLKWAGYLKDWDGPEAGERPTGFIIILLDTAISKSAGCDHGIAAQNILLRATELGYGGCIFGAINRQGLMSALEIPDRYEILLTISLGKPVEEVRLVEVAEGGDIKYYRDKDGVHYVPKRSLKEVIV